MRELIEKNEDHVGVWVPVVPFGNEPSDKTSVALAASCGAKLNLTIAVLTKLSIATRIATIVTRRANKK